MKRLGIDIGSLYLKAVLLDNNRIIDYCYQAHNGNIHTHLSELLSLPSFSDYNTIGITGNTESLIDDTIDNTLALIEGIRFLLPDCRNVFSVGGETFSLILFNENGEYTEHALNPPCASGTGSFIEQQAERLSISVPDLAERALSYKGKTPSIATRCAVFAKTDIIHAMQEGYSLDAVCAGLCEGIARNIIDGLVKGRELTSPAGIVGGVSLNRKIVGSMQGILNLEVTVPEYTEVVAAIGSALVGEKAEFDKTSLSSTPGRKRDTRPPLSLKYTQYPDFDEYAIEQVDHIEVFSPKKSPEIAGGVFIGIDIGSTSTKAVVVNHRGEVIGGYYTATQGDPINAVSALLDRIRTHSVPEHTPVLGVSTTGSGRKMVKELFGADFHMNEITAHAKAAVTLHPQVDTILEIGGQDSKFTRIRGGDVYYSVMNYVCAAGTGSFIEEQAKRLGLSLDQFSEAAFNARAPYTSDRCTVYMERDLGALLSEGWPPEALAAAVLNSVRDNYMSKVVNKNAVGEYIVFQGATARNKALIAAFERLLDKPIHVSPLCHLTGALGAALSCVEKTETGAVTTGSAFIWDLEVHNQYEEVCDRCVNRCLLTVVEQNGKKVGWGMKCGQEYEERSPQKTVPSTPEQRYQASLSAAGNDDTLPTTNAAPSIGVPLSLYNVEYAPLWIRFLTLLGCTVKTSGTTDKAMQYGKEIVNSDFCAPMVLAHGLMQDLVTRGADYLFYPAIVSERNPEQDSHRFKEKLTDDYFCYYSQYLPSIVGKLTSIDLDQQMISPLLNFNTSTAEEIAALLYRAMSEKIPSLNEEQVVRSFLKAYREYNEAKAEQRSVYTKAGSPQFDSATAAYRGIDIAIIGRPYIMFDPRLNLNIPKKLESHGARLFWQEEFDLEDFEPTYAQRYLERMHWHYGKQIIRLAEFAARKENLFIVFLTSFRCSPDSFLLSYVKDIMAHFDKPFITLQLDEHSSDVGYETRIEAGLQSFKNYLDRLSVPEAPPRVEGASAEPSREKDTAALTEKSPAGTRVSARNDALAPGDTVLIPYLDHLISRFWADCFINAGYTAFPLHPDEKSLNTGYQYANGGECMPLVSLIGSVIETVKKEQIDPKKAFFYIPTVCMACNFPQFPILSDLAFSQAGLDGLKIGLINSMAPGEILGSALSIKMLESNIIGSILYKLFFRIRPYETVAGATETVFMHAKQRISGALRNSLDLKSELKTIVEEFSAVERDESAGRKPKIALIGDIYVKYNELVNQNLHELVDSLGGELIVPSLTEYPFHFYDADVRLFGDNPRPYKLLKTIERRYETIAKELIDDQMEPEFAECVELMEAYNVKHYIAGETSINIGRALYYLEHRLVDAILHVNPMFCCPGVVTSSIYRKMQKDYGVPIIDIFYDGTGNPNRKIIPHMHYLKS